MSNKSAKPRQRAKSAAEPGAHYALDDFKSEELTITRMDTLVTDRAVLASNTYFEGGDVLVCHAGKFRFRFDDSSQPIEIGPKETLVIYPGNVVTIEAIAKGCVLKYVVFGGTRVADFFDSFGFYDRQHFAGDTQEEVFDLAVKLSKTDIRQALSYLRDALNAFSHSLGSGIDAKRHQMLATIHRSIRAGLPRLKSICEELNVNRVTLNRRFAAYGLGNPSEYINLLQYRRARQLLLSTDLPVAEIAKTVGIASPVYFSDFFRKHAGMSASDLRKKHLGR